MPDVVFHFPTGRSRVGDRSVATCGTIGHMDIDDGLSRTNDVIRLGGAGNLTV